MSDLLDILNELTKPDRDPTNKTSEEMTFMRAVVQRVTRASVTVNKEIVGEIGSGLVVLLGVALGRPQADADYLAHKIVARIFDDWRAE